MASQLTLTLGDDETEDPSYLTDQLLTYIGNKRSLLGFLATGMDRARRLLGVDEVTFLDLFAGSGVVSRFAKRFSRHVIANDLEPYSAVVNRCYLSNRDEVDFAALRVAIRELEELQHADQQPGFITDLYAPKDEQDIKTADRVFYTRDNALFLDTASRALEHAPQNLRDLLLGPLLSAASVHANTSGVFKGFYKHDGIGRFGGSNGDALSRIRRPISWRLPVLSNFNRSFEVHQGDANELVGSMDRIDIAYFDPPYNQHPYGSNYFMLNLLVDYRAPEAVSRVSGIPETWQRSAYNKRPQSGPVLFDAIERCPASIILISYNSEGFVPIDRFVEHLTSLGDVEVLDTLYNTFRGCRNLHARDNKVTEFLFLLDKR